MIAAMAPNGHDPIARFIRWLEDARRTRIPNYEAMALATAERNGKTSVRFVLLKGIDERGFVFFSDARSRKGRDCTAIRTPRLHSTGSRKAAGTRGRSHACGG